MDTPILDEIAFAEFRATLGEAAAAIWVKKFLQTVDRVSLARDLVEADRDEVFEIAHLVIARAGLVGCRCLVETCIELQRASKEGDDFLAPYASMNAAAADAGLALRQAGRQPG